MESDSDLSYHSENDVSSESELDVSPVSDAELGKRCVPPRRMTTSARPRVSKQTIENVDRILAKRPPAKPRTRKAPAKKNEQNQNEFYEFLLDSIDREQKAYQTVTDPTVKGECKNRITLFLDKLLEMGRITVTDNNSVMSLIQ